jgi:hypothetical protein
VDVGRWVDVFRIDPAAGERFGRLTTGAGGWVDVAVSIAVRTGHAFVAVVTEELEA